MLDRDVYAGQIEKLRQEADHRVIAELLPRQAPELPVENDREAQRDEQEPPEQQVERAGRLRAELGADEAGTPRQHENELKQE